jgi:hypothetical protein
MIPIDVIDQDQQSLVEYAYYHFGLPMIAGTFEEERFITSGNVSRRAFRVLAYDHQFQKIPVSYVFVKMWNDPNSFPRRAIYEAMYDD